LILRKDKEVAFLEGKRGMVVGAMEDSVYETERFTLDPGDGLCLYTDGVTEAMNGQEELFSEERLKSQAIDLQGKSIQEVIGGIMGEIHSFSHGAEQSDDITMLMIQFKGL
jgi:sigma-B regulation protein RsbU (phosphoserine phosphatase)